MSENLEDEIENFDVPHIPLSFINPHKPDERIWTTKDNLTYSFDLTNDVKCYI